MINIEVVKGLVIMLFVETGSGIQSRDKKLSILNIPRAIEIDDPHDGLESFFIFYLMLHDPSQLIKRDYSIAVTIHTLEHLLKPLFLLVCDKLTDTKCKNDCLQFIFKLS